MLGGFGDDKLFGKDGNDTLNDTAGNDLLNGGAGNDYVYFTFNEGKDTLIGGAGNDNLSIFQLTGDFTAKAPGQTVKLLGGSTITGFESYTITTAYDSSNHKITVLGGDDNVTTSSGNDKIIGNAGRDYLNASTGKDSVFGGKGDDDLSVGGGGADLVEGGAGIDQVNLRYYGEAGDMTLKITGTNATLTGGTVVKSVERYWIQFGVGDDKIVSVGKAQSINANGGDGNDILIGTKNSYDYLSGENGDDRLEGGDGNDGLYGGSGSDTIFGGAGNDSIYDVGGVKSVINAGDGNDTINADNGYGDDVGNFKIDAGTGDDTVIRGYSATGTFNAKGGAGIDYLQLSLSQDTTPVVFKMSNNISMKGGMIKATDFERINLSSGSGNDKLTGGKLDDTFSSNAGNDKLTGYAGNDYLNGGGGVDSLYGGSGNDTLISGSYVLSETGEVLNGGTGNDYIIAWHGSTVIGGKGIDNLNLNLSDQSGNFTLDITKASNTLDAETKISSIEQLNYTGGNGIDRVTGGKLYDVINGGGGNDVIHGGGSGDQLSDGAGNDKVYGDAGDDFLSRTDATGQDVFYGGSGYDTFTFASYTLSAQLDLQTAANNAGQAAGLKLKGIEKIVGSYADDDMRGSGGNDNFDGSFADDVLMGRGGNDTLNGGSGDDWLTGGSGKDVFVFDYGSRGGNGDIITDFTHGDDKLAIYNGFGMTQDTFHLVNGPNPTTNKQEATFLFETDNGRLWFDADGSGTYTESELIAILQGVTSLSISDFTFL